MGKVNRFINYGGAAGQVGGDLSHRASLMLKTLLQNLKLKQKLVNVKNKCTVEWEYQNCGCGFSPNLSSGSFLTQLEFPRVVEVCRKGKQK